MTYPNTVVSYIRTGVKEYLKMFNHHVKEIEKPDFQIQFVALGGYSVLELVLSTDAKVNSLLGELATGQVGVQEVYDRMMHIRSRVMAEKDLSFDGSTVVYLYCLSHMDLDLAYRASLSILRTRGLFWSRQLAVRIAELISELTASIDSSSSTGTVATYDADAYFTTYGSPNLTENSRVEIERGNLYPQYPVELSMAS